MTLDEIIRNLEDQTKDRESSIDEDDPECIFRTDARALRETVDLLKELLPGHEPVRAPITIKDFKLGQTAYMIDEIWRKVDGKATAVEITKVGRKYVTVKVAGQREIRFCEPVSPADCLVEDRDWGAPRLLFFTAEAMDEYNEREELKAWTVKAADWRKIGSYTLAQLRAVKKILEENNHE